MSLSGVAGGTVVWWRMVEVVISEGKLRYCGQMIRRLRYDHQKVSALIGPNPHYLLRQCMAQSLYRRAAFIDGKLAALWGVTGSIMSPFGYVWLCLTEEAARRPILVLREARRQIEEIMKIKTVLVTDIMGDDVAAIRLATYLGFSASSHGLGAQASSRWSRRSLIRHLNESPDVRVPSGQTYAVRLSYQADRPMMGVQ